MKFVWAEISYLSMWWSQQPQATRDTFKRLVHNGQIEIVTGGWVMPDEANSHYFALVDQLIEGHKVRNTHPLVCDDPCFVFSACHAALELKLQLVANFVPPSHFFLSLWLCCGCSGSLRTLACARPAAGPSILLVTPQPWRTSSSAQTSRAWCVHLCVCVCVCVCVCLCKC